MINDSFNQPPLPPVLICLIISLNSPLAQRQDFVPSLNETKLINGIINLRTGWHTFPRRNETISMAIPVCFFRPFLCYRRIIVRLVPLLRTGEKNYQLADGSMKEVLSRGTRARTVGPWIIDGNQFERLQLTDRH